MQKYTDDDIRNMNKITCKIAADYLGISPMAVSIGMRNSLLPIGFAVHNEERDRTYSETPEWIEWASRKADWYDPTKDVEDEYLGKREHGKNKEEKDIDKVSVKRGWYW